jgi:hypothetical protein
VQIANHGDAHRLRLRDNCVDGVHREAVLEHLEDPHIDGGAGQ